MHGLIFTAFRLFTGSEYPEIADGAWDGSQRYLATEAYGDEEFERLVARVAELSGDSRRTVLRRFGIFAGLSTFRLMYPEYYAAHADTFSFIADVESRIHDVVRHTIPDAAPPRLDVRRIGAEGLSIAYTSERRLCELLEGLVVGVSRFYGDRIRIEQPLCMHRGDIAGCSFVITRE